MKSRNANIIATIATAAVLFSPLLQAPAFAQDQPSSSMMSYAPQDEVNGQDRFEQFRLDNAFGDYGEEHELNDAWLGISAYSQDGEYLGYIEDALLDAQGNVKELVIAPPQGSVAVQILASNAVLKSDSVNLKMTSNEFASILTDGEVVASVN